MKMKRWILGGGALLLSSVALAGISGPGPAFAPNEPLAGLTLDPMKLSNEETLERSNQMQTRMLSTEARVQALQKRAEIKKDMVQVNCTSDKLVQVRGYVAVGTQAAAAVQRAITLNDVGARAHGFERQTIVYQKVLVLGTEAEGCAGEDVSYIGATRVDVEIDPSIPEEDPTIPGVISIVPVTPRPPEASPFT